MEKNSAAPDVQFKGSDSIRATLVLPYVEFVLTEVLKNSLQVRHTLLATISHVDNKRPALLSLSFVRRSAHHCAG